MKNIFLYFIYFSLLYFFKQEFFIICFRKIIESFEKSVMFYSLRKSLNSKLSFSIRKCDENDIDLMIKLKR
jgi:hypothetical protein